MNENCHTIANGLIGFAASCLGVLSTFQEQFEWWVRITGGMMGIFVTAAAIYRIVQPKNKP